MFISDGEIFVQIGLDQNVYTIGEPLQVSIHIDARPARRISKLKVTAIQAVDVAMFSSGNFKVRKASVEKYL